MCVILISFCEYRPRRLNYTDNCKVQTSQTFFRLAICFDWSAEGLSRVPGYVFSYFVICKYCLVDNNNMVLRSVYWTSFQRQCIDVELGQFRFVSRQQASAMVCSATFWKATILVHVCWPLRCLQIDVAFNIIIIGPRKILKFVRLLNVMTYFKQLVKHFFSIPNNIN